LRDPGRD